MLVSWEGNGLCQCCIQTRKFTWFQTSFMKRFYNERKSNPLFKPLTHDLSESHTSTLCLKMRILEYK